MRSIGNHSSRYPGHLCNGAQQALERVATWQGSGRGKRGGLRAIYYWATKDDVVLMLLAYPKNERDDLSPEQKKVLKALVKEEFK